MVRLGVGMLICCVRYAKMGQPRRNERHWVVHFDFPSIPFGPGGHSEYTVSWDSPGILPGWEVLQCNELSACPTTAPPASVSVLLRGRMHWNSSSNFVVFHCFEADPIKDPQVLSVRFDTAMPQAGRFGSTGGWLDRRH